jgi:TolA-binding protein
MRLLKAKTLIKQKKYSEAHEVLVAFLKEYPKDPGAKEAEEQLARFKAVPTQHPQ